MIFKNPTRHHKRIYDYVFILHVFPMKRCSKTYVKNVYGNWLKANNELIRLGNKGIECIIEKRIVK